MRELFPTNFLKFCLLFCKESFVKHFYIFVSLVFLSIETPIQPSDQYLLQYLMIRNLERVVLKFGCFHSYLCDLNDQVVLQKMPAGVPDDAIIARTCEIDCNLQSNWMVMTGADITSDFRSMFKISQQQKVPK